MNKRGFTIKKISNLNLINHGKLLFLYAVGIVLFSNNATGQLLELNPLLIVGEKVVDTSVIELSKRTFKNYNKLTTNANDYYVSQYTYSMFALGRNIRETIYDSMFPTKMKEALRDNKTNYRYINIEGVKFKNKNKQEILPLIDTVKIKFLYP